MKQVDTRDLKSLGFGRTGSIPVPGTTAIPNTQATSQVAFFILESWRNTDGHRLFILLSQLKGRSEWRHVGQSCRSALRCKIAWASDSGWRLHRARDHQQAARSRGRLLHTLCIGVPMKCWICGGEANSGEHFIKASDLRSLFGHVTQNKPIYIHTSAKRNQPIRGIKSDKLTYSTRICSTCNNKLTQPHDRAWEQLSGYLRSQNPPIQGGTVIRLDNVFPGSVHRSMLYVHLFFLKLFGCLIVEHSIPLDISEFSRCILYGTPHPKVRLAFWTGLHDTLRKHAGCTPVQTAALNGYIVYAGWFYIVGRVAVNVIYTEPTAHRKGLQHSWHPETVGKHVRIVSHNLRLTIYKQMASITGAQGSA